MRRHPCAVGCITLLFCFSGLACSHSSTGEASPAPIRGDLPEPLQQFEAGVLPLTGERVEFEDMKAFPPKLKGLEVDPDFRLDIKPGTRPPMREARRQMRELALADARVRESLGNRFALLGSGWMERDKDQGADAASDRYRLTFYSYPHNVAVYVVVQRDKVVEVTRGEKSDQPGESHEEVEAAADLVAKDERYRALVEGLVAQGIQTPSDDGNRRLYVTFHRQRHTPALVDATVDMTLGRVVTARRLQRYR